MEQVLVALATCAVFHLAVCAFKALRRRRRPAYAAILEIIVGEQGEGYVAMVLQKEFARMAMFDPVGALGGESDSDSGSDAADSDAAGSDAADSDSDAADSDAADSDSDAAGSDAADSDAASSDTASSDSDAASTDNSDGAPDSSDDLSDLS